MKISFFELEGWEEDIIRQSLPESEFFFSKNKIDELDMPEPSDSEILSVFVNSRVTPQVLERFPNLKLVTTRSAGFDHVDVAFLNQKGIPVAYVPGYGDNTVAEFAFGLILNLTRKLYPAIDQMKESGSFSLAGFRGMDLKGKSIGIIGTGRIGKEMIKIAKGLDMKIVAYDPFPDQNFSQQIGFSYATLEELLKTSDVISVHCPYNKETHHLINKENINFIKKGAYLINTARGGIVETDALIEALNKKILAGVGLDVLEEEGETKDELNLLMRAHPKEEELKTMLQNHILMKMPNVLITPHNAFNTQEAMERILGATLQNIKSFLAGNPENLVKL